MAGKSYSCYALSAMRFCQKHIAGLYFLFLLPIFLYFGIIKYLWILVITLPLAFFAYKKFNSSRKTSQILAAFLVLFAYWGAAFLLSFPFLPYPFIKPSILGENFRAEISHRYPDGTKHDQLYRDLKRNGFALKTLSKTEFSASYSRKEWVFCSSDYHIRWKANAGGAIKIERVYQGSACV